MGYFGFEIDCRCTKGALIISGKMSFGIVIFTNETSLVFCIIELEFNDQGQPWNVLVFSQYGKSVDCLITGTETGFSCCEIPPTKVVLDDIRVSPSKG